MSKARDHGGGLDAAVARWGGARGDWLDLSTGINPVPYPVGEIAEQSWTALPDRAAFARLEAAARRFWNLPDGAAVIAAPGASALIARMPMLAQGRRVRIAVPTYNEHAAAFAAQGWDVVEAGAADAQVVVHPNNPDGRFWDGASTAGFTVIDESFCDICPDETLIARTAIPRTVVLKSFGKFWGLAGLRLGFAIAHPDTFAPGGAALSDILGPWAVSGPALEIGARALEDTTWAEATRARLSEDAARLDKLMAPHGAAVGGTSLFRLYEVADAAAMQDRLGRNHILSRIFPYSDTWVRLGLPAPNGWARLERALRGSAP